MVNVRKYTSRMDPMGSEMPYYVWISLVNLSRFQPQTTHLTADFPPLHVLKFSWRAQLDMQKTLPSTKKRGPMVELQIRDILQYPYS